LPKLEPDVFGKNLKLKPRVLGPKKTKFPSGTLDPDGRKNSAWKTFVPKYADGTVPLAYSGFIRAGKGTSCANCEYFVSGHCGKIHGNPRIRKTDCCNYYEWR
jgi:hypothetical protein